MSKRRKALEKVFKKANAGFVGEPFLAIIQDEDPEPCFLCEDENCQEWPTLLGIPHGVAYHVSECEMEDA